MTSEQNKAIVRRLYEAFATNDQATLKEVTADEFVIFVPGMPGPVDRETHLQGIGFFTAAFSDIDSTVEEQIAEGDKVATRITWRATHTGDFQGLAPTGKQVSVSAVSFDSIKDGKIVVRRFNQDDLGLMQQLGAIPPPQPSG